MAAARLILLIVAASFPLAAALLLWMKRRGEEVPWYWPTAWLACGVVGLAAASFLSDGRPWAWGLCLLSLAPILVVSTVVDVRHGLWWVVLTDVAGLAAVAWGLWQARGAVV